MQVESALGMESPEALCARVFRRLKPRAPMPEIVIRFRPFANPHSYARLQDGRLELRISDLLAGAPPPVLEALFFLLLGKLLGRPIPPGYARRYRQYLSRRDVQRSLHLVRQIRGRKILLDPRGRHYDLEEIFDQLNARFFHGLLGRPVLGWSARAARTTLGHWDPSHNAIVISNRLDRADVPRLLVEYVVFHEMLHLKYPPQARGGRRMVHTAEFRAAERAFPRRDEARKLLKQLVQS